MSYVVVDVSKKQPQDFSIRVYKLGAIIMFVNNLKFSSIVYLTLNENVLIYLV